ncbi:MAG TPA: rhamnulokinase [Mobilitalea sp.]|nr:rhamnulokinase [Mobilitalea sp.]
MQEYFLAVDIGASSGRLILGWLDEGRLKLEEIHRFENGMTEKNGHLCWDVDNIYSEIIKGMKKCKDASKIPVCMGIDTWAVDFVLLDEDDKVLGDAVGYRDNRTVGIDKLVYSVISEDNLYERTGIQKQIFNTIYQLMAVKDKEPQNLNRAKSLLMIPDYLNFLLTGIKKTEYTNATTTQLVNPKTCNWDYELIRMLDYPEHIFQEIIKPGTSLGYLKEDVAKEVGFNCEVIAPATHDTGSAVVAVPSVYDDTLYISSGTWSLMGIERTEPDCSLKSKEHNFTNEGGFDYRFRYLKNIMGLWMIQSVKKEFEKNYSYDEICRLASLETIDSIVDCNDERFLAPKSMTEEIKKYCLETGQKVPQTDAQTAAVIYNSLAVCYRNTVEELEGITGRKYHSINIIGGGSDADYLNRITAKMTGRKVYAGPKEATAIGNILVQMISTKKLSGLKEARKLVQNSFEIKEYVSR